MFQGSVVCHKTKTKKHLARENPIPTRAIEIFIISKRCRAASAVETTEYKRFIKVIDKAARKPW